MRIGNTVAPVQVALLDGGGCHGGLECGLSRLTCGSSTRCRCGAGSWSDSGAERRVFGGDERG